MNVLWLTAMVAALFTGFCVGRLAMAGNEDGKEAAPENEPGGRHTKERQTLGEGAAGSVGSPVSGEVEDMCGGERPTVVIRPSEDRIYAPTGGKITKLFPMGNAFLFNTEFGAELYIQAGDCGDELWGGTFVPGSCKMKLWGRESCCWNLTAGDWRRRERLPGCPWRWRPGNMGAISLPLPGNR